MIELLTPDEMGRADAMTIAAGTPGIDLMEKAGKAVADIVLSRFPDARKICVVAGPGNNGGDGFVAARLLAEQGRAVTMLMLGDSGALKGDAEIAAGLWEGETLAAEANRIGGHDVIVDALFGAGLTRSIEGRAAELVKAINDDPANVVAVDLPSGVNGASGSASGAAIMADETVTFFRAKPGHLLFPGRQRCGNVSVHDIGIPPTVLSDINPQAFSNEPDLWRDHWAPPSFDGHKYSRGHAVVVSGPMSATGAARLAAGAALRAGAGLVTLASPPGALLVNAAHMTSVMVKPFRGGVGLEELLSDQRLNAVAIGPGAGVSNDTENLIRVCLDGDRAVVLDADALTCFKKKAQSLSGLVLERAERQVVLTPHEGEFARLFPELSQNSGQSKLERARAAAKRTGAVVVLKGPDTVIASPDGRAAINANAPPWLATAGSGDALTGIITGLLAQKLPGFEAASMGVWLHGAAAARYGPGMIADDIASGLPAAFAELI